MASIPDSLKIPHDSAIVDDNGKLSREWEKFFRDLTKSVDSLGVERYFALTNNQSTPADIEGLVFTYKSVSQVSVDYYIQRVTTGTGATEKTEHGTFYLSYQPSSNSWTLTNGPTTSGITLSVTSAGQVQYTSTNITGTASISKITWKARTLAAKHANYSQVGR